MTWVLLSLMYSFGAQSAKIAPLLPKSVPQPVYGTALTQSSIATAPRRPPPDIDFALKVNGTLWRWDTLAFFVLPGERLSFSVSSQDREGGFDWQASGGSFTGNSDRDKSYTAPTSTGTYRLDIVRGRHAKRITVFVMVPFAHQTAINGYQIGTYSRQSHFAKLGLPRGFVEVTEGNLNAWLSPHFRLKEFVCHQPSGFPKYVVLREKLIRKLEGLIDRLGRTSIRCAGLHLISGYRTPYFNNSNGNAEHSVHTYGGAADIYIDADNDGMMDDLNRDGRRDVKDAVALYNVIDQFEKEQPEFLGGDGYYAGSGAHGAFVHTDARGERSRWHQ